MAVLVAFVSALSSQQAYATVTADKIVVVNGGRFEFSPPFTDYVTVGVYTRSTRTYAIIDTILDQSVQDVVTFGRGANFRAYVLTTTMLTSYDLNTNTKLVQRTGLPGGSKLAFTEPGELSDLIITRGFGTPAGQPTVIVVDRDDLTDVISFPQITTEASHVWVSPGKQAFVTLPGSFLSDSGSFAVLDLNSNTITGTYNAGRNAKGISSIMPLGNNAVAFCSNGFGSRDGKLFFIDTASYATSFTSLNKPVGSGVGSWNGRVYGQFSTSGIGAYSPSLGLDSVIVPRSYAAARIDTVNRQFVLTDPEYTRAGWARLYSLQGAALDSFRVGISPEAIAVAYYTTTTSLEPVKNEQSPELSLYPNPVTDLLYVKLSKVQDHGQPVIVRGATGQEVFRSEMSNSSGTIKLNLSTLPAGIYYVHTAGQTKRIIKL